jgi:hypothetical protein
MARLLAATAASLLLSLTTAQQCFEKYQCIFHHDVGGQEYSWDMHQLCRPAGQEYTFLDAYNHTTVFNVCGMASQVCSPGYNLYDSVGVAIQSWGDAPVPCQTNCKNFNTGEAIPCCTAPCAVLGTQYLQFSILDSNNPGTGGVQFVHPGMPPDVDDPSNCPPDPNTGLARERQLTMNLYCDPSGSSTGLKIMGITETSVCRYLLEATTAAACGVQGDPFDGYLDNPAHSFGYVVLGAFLAVFVAGVYSFGDRRGWWNPIIDRLPRWLKCCCSDRGSSSASSGSSGSSYSGGYSSSTYKNIGNATPIAASAYGTA